MSQKYMYISVPIRYVRIFRGWGRAALDGIAPPSFSARFSFLICKIIQKMKFYSNNIKDFQGRGRGSPLASFWDESTKNKEEKHGAEPCRTLLHYPPPHPCVLPVVVGRYAPSSRAPCRRCVIHVVVGPYVSLLGLTCHCWALRVVVGPYASSSDPRIVAGAYTSSCRGISSLGNGLLRLRLLLAVVEFESSPCSNRPRHVRITALAFEPPPLCSRLSSPCSSHPSSSFSPCSSRPSSLTSYSSASLSPRLSRPPLPLLLLVSTLLLLLLLLVSPLLLAVSALLPLALAPPHCLAPSSLSFSLFSVSFSPFFPVVISSSVHRRVTPHRCCPGVSLCPSGRTRGVSNGD